MKTVSFLNQFAQSCESRFMELEHKIQKIEASLLILESQLSSIPGLEGQISSSTEHAEIKQNENISSTEVSDAEKPEDKVEFDSANVTTDPAKTEPEGSKAKDDPRYSKFFKMLHVGVPEPAVKLKMKNEGVNPGILDKPDQVIPE
ncbi:unnamed protein product [Acanthoscelides obtectus]|uniref:WASH complex subunit 3 n=1 Tax=Acanthoscelides obtectus TaxID=200917 RepID=A0A9P0PIQ6_ACAOB|nr:unnamed protein product [Acanthoscelides obtectus]CAK1677968.1 WASH complex subunit 3 [Acanthoscelides obtectus]